MFSDLFTIERPEYEAEDVSMSVECLEEKVQDGIITDQYSCSTICEEFSSVVVDNIRYEICGVYHGPDPMKWRHSKLRRDIAKEAEENNAYYTHPVLVEEGLLECNGSMMLNDIQYALDRLKILKKNKRNRTLQEQQLQKDYADKMDEYFNATAEVIRATMSNSAKLFSEGGFLNYYSKAMLLPQPIGMESNLLYLSSYFGTHDIDDPTTLNLYVCMTPIRPAYMAKKLNEIAGQSNAKIARLYCGRTHVDEVAFLLKNSEYIGKFIGSEDTGST